MLTASYLLYTTVRNGSLDFCQDDRFEFSKYFTTHNVSTSQSSSGVYSSDNDSDRAGTHLSS